MPASFALAGLILLALGLITANLKRMDLGGGFLLASIAALAFVATMVMSTVLVGGAVSVKHEETIIVFTAVAAGIGWFCTLGALAGMKSREEG